MIKPTIWNCPAYLYSLNYSRQSVRGLARWITSAGVEPVERLRSCFPNVGLKDIPQRLLRAIQCEPVGIAQAIIFQHRLDLGEFGENCFHHGGLLSQAENQE